MFRSAPMTIHTYSLTICRYDLVKSLKSEIETYIGPIVDDEISRYTERGHEHVSDTDTLVARITEKVTKSQQ